MSQSELTTICSHKMFYFFQIIPKKISFEWVRLRLERGRVSEFFIFFFLVPFVSFINFELKLVSKWREIKICLAAAKTSSLGSCSLRKSDSLCNLYTKPACSYNWWVRFRLSDSRIWLPDSRIWLPDTWLLTFHALLFWKLMMFFPKLKKWNVILFIFVLFRLTVSTIWITVIWFCCFSFGQFRMLC